MKLLVWVSNGSAVKVILYNETRPFLARRALFCILIKLHHWKARYLNS